MQVMNLHNNHSIFLQILFHIHILPLLHFWLYSTLVYRYHCMPELRDDLNLVHKQYVIFKAHSSNLMVNAILVLPCSLPRISHNHFQCMGKHKCIFLRSQALVSHEDCNEKLCSSLFRSQFQNSKLYQYPS